MLLSNTKTSTSKIPNPIFPTWKDLMMDVLNIKSSEPFNDGRFKLQDLNLRLKSLDIVKESIHNFHPTQIIRTLAIGADSPELDSGYYDLEEQFKRSCIAQNQFFTIYDIKQGWHKEIDPNINRALGLKPHEFSMLAMAGLDSENPLYHRDDLYHMIRWASLAYMIFAFPGFNWDTLKDYYYVSYRVGSKRSSIETIRKARHVVLEKRCFPIFIKDADNVTKPVFHFDQWSVLDASNFEFVKPKWVTSSEQSYRVNSLFYLFNAYLLDIHVKYLLILNYKMQFDRNKAVAVKFCEDFKTFTGIEVEFDEIQVGNALSKTVRQKIETAYNLWDKRDITNRITVSSDSEAIHCARALGLLPIPNDLLELIFRSTVV